MRAVMGCVMFLVLGVALSRAVVSAEDFSADMVSSSPEGSFTAKLYVSGDKSRMETSGATTISRMDKKVVWILMPAEKMYMESLTRLQERRVTMFRVGVLFIALGLLFLVALTVLLAIELSPNPFIG